MAWALRELTWGRRVSDLLAASNRLLLGAFVVGRGEQIGVATVLSPLACHLWFKPPVRWRTYLATKMVREQAYEPTAAAFGFKAAGVALGHAASLQRPLG